MSDENDTLPEQGEGRGDPHAGCHSHTWPLPTSAISPPRCPPFPPCLLFSLACLAYLQAVKHWGIVGLSFFLSFTWRWVFALRASRNCYSVAGKKRKTSCFCLLKMLYFNCSLPFLSSLPPRLTSPLCIFIMAVTWRKGRIACPHTRWSSSSSSSLSILLITCNWSFLRYHYCNYLEEIDEKKFLDNFTQRNYYSFF